MRKYFSISLLFLIPSFIFAAGFAKQALFLSQSTVYEGQTVFIYAVVTDDTPTYFQGELRFSDATELIGTVPVSLKPGHAATVSVPWTPKAGEHTITAKLVTGDDTQTENQKATFYVSKVPSPPQTSAIDPLVTKPKVQGPLPSTVDTSTPILNSIDRFFPSIAQSVAPMFFSVDTFRKNSVKNLDQGTLWSKKEISKAATAPSGTSNTLWMILSTFVLYICASLIYSLGSISIFYPAITIIILLLLWKTLSWIRN